MVVLPKCNRKFYQESFILCLYGIPYYPLAFLTFYDLQLLKRRVNVHLSSLL